MRSPGYSLKHANRMKIKNKQVKWLLWRLLLSQGSAIEAGWRSFQVEQNLPTATVSLKGTRYLSSFSNRCLINVRIDRKASTIEQRQFCAGIRERGHKIRYQETINTGSRARNMWQKDMISRSKHVTKRQDHALKTRCGAPNRQDHALKSVKKSIGTH